MLTFWPQPRTVLLPVGYHDVAGGKLAAVVTSLEMFAPPAPRPEPPARASGWDVRRVEAPETDWYQSLFRRIGEEYLWASRLTISDSALRMILNDPLVEVYALRDAGRDHGLLELDFRVHNECELSFFGVTSALIGTGAGRWLMTRAHRRAWSRPIRRFWVHTCTLDHPGAIAFYERAGFRPFKRQIEIFDDPRATGILPSTAASHIPLL